MRRRYPAKLNVKVNLATGDTLPATAFRQRGCDENGLVRYVVAHEDGGPLKVRRKEATGLELDMLPGHASVELLFADSAES